MINLNLLDIGKGDGIKLLIFEISTFSNTLLGEAIITGINNWLFRILSHYIKALIN